MTIQTEELQFAFHSLIRRNSCFNQVN